MRSVFDQYRQPENRLTHSLAVALGQDRALLGSFVGTFGPKGHPPVRELKVIEQGLPGRPDVDEDEAEARGLPDALMFSDDGWALVIESKISDALATGQLQRHRRTIERCGFDQVIGLAITVRPPAIDLDGWHRISWKDVYSWSQKHRDKSQWARFLIEFFNVAEARMANEGYLKEGTITEFSGVSFDPYTYLEAKRVLRLLTGKLRDNSAFMKEMRLDPGSGRPAITDQSPRLWDFISFTPPDGTITAFQAFPHCTIGIGPVDAEAMVTFPNGMSPALRRKLHGPSFDDFVTRLREASGRLTVSLKGLKAYRPMVRAIQRRYRTQRSTPMMDGSIEFDLRTPFGEPIPHFGPAIRKQPQWARAAYDLLVNKQSNIQFQIGVEFYYPQVNGLADRDADQHFMAVFAALRPFVGAVIEANPR